MKAKFSGAYGVLEVEGSPAEIAELMRAHVRPAARYVPAQPGITYVPTPLSFGPPLYNGPGGWAPYGWTCSTVTFSDGKPKP